MLDDDDREILDFEARWWKHRGAKEVAIVDELGMRPHRYYQRLHALCPAAGGSGLLAGRRAAGAQAGGAGAGGAEAQCWPRMKNSTTSWTCLALSSPRNSASWMVPPMSSAIADDEKCPIIDLSLTIDTDRIAA